MPGVFVSYRRDDAMGYAGALVRELQQTFNPNEVFMDISGIRGGEAFPEVIRRKIESADVMLVLIGPQWLDIRDHDGKRRLTEEGDYVRMEVALGLKKGLRVVPVLVGGAQMPSADQLPEDLQDLATRNAVWLGDRTWDKAVDLIRDESRKAFFAVDTEDKQRRPLVPGGFDPGTGGFRFPLWIGLAFFLFGLGFSAIGLFIALEQAAFGARALEVEGQVVSLRAEDNAFRPIVTFNTRAGRSVTFESNTGTNPPQFSIGDTVGVLYDPTRIEDARIKSAVSSWSLYLIFGLLGGIFLLIGGGVMVHAFGKRRRWKERLRLLNEGRPIMTSFIGVEVDGGVSVNDQHPYRIVTEWEHPVTKEAVRFQSEYVWRDPTNLLKQRSITVVIDPNNLERYLVDLSELPDEFKQQPGRLKKK